MTSTTSPRRDVTESPLQVLPAIFRLLAVGALLSTVFVLTGSAQERSMSEQEKMEAQMEAEMQAEMEMEEAMEREMSESYGGSGGRSRLSTAGSIQETLLESFQKSFVSNISSLNLDALLVDSSQIPEVSKGPVLMGDAEKAYQAGNFPLAMQLYFGFLATEYEQATGPLQSVKFSKLLVRPVWQTRWAVSYTVRGDTDVTDPSPIQLGAGSSRSGGQRSGQPPRGRFGQGGNPDDVDEEMEMEMEMQMEMEMEMEAEMERSRQQDRGGSGRPSSTSAFAQTQSREMLSPGAKEELDQFLGLVADVVSAEFSKRHAQGDFGVALISVGAEKPAEDAAENRSIARSSTRAPAVKFEIPSDSENSVDDLIAEAPDAAPMWVPGLMFYGEGDSKEITKLCAFDQVDLLLHFDITLKQRNDQVKNICRCRLIHVAANKSLAVSKGIDNTEAANQAASGRGTNEGYVKDSLANLFIIIDRDAKAIPLPKMSAAAAKTPRRFTACQFKRHEPADVGRSSSLPIAWTRRSRGCRVRLSNCRRR